MSPVRAIVTDIEGTTSSIAFVAEVLFPYARARLAAYVAAHAQDLAPLLARVRAEAGDAGLDEQACVAQLLAWADADAKIGPLKELQGLIWAEGYADGTLKGHIYADAAAGLARWQAAGLKLYVYSSGSVAAQKLLFGHSEAGDLTGLFAGWFDTGVGGKKEAASYAAIARAIGETTAIAAAEILFLSDVPAELAAARAAGLQVILLDREGAAPAGDFAVAVDFATILPAGAAA
ncbi:MAG TPA: acireductone synthase [Novosphingobium sp.]|nr:acireductone synthase [Novosphingobium sp.]HZV10377.1 acireductone synthase [Novosphingobium sp.]